MFIDPDVINYEQFVDIADRAGRFVGIGDHRTFFGRYEALVERVKE